MSLEERTSSLQLFDRKYYFIQFENDIQIIFDEISRSKDIARVGVNILKGNIYLKGDYFIPLKSTETFRLNCEELVKKLQTISCVLDVEVDTNHNLTFRLKRSMVYKSVLQEVTRDPEQYGMFNINQSVLVLTNQDKSKSLDNLRNNLLAEHVISLLTNNGVKVFYNDFKPAADLGWQNSSSLVCCDKCTLVDVCKDLEEKIHVCDYVTDSDNNKTCIDAKKFIEDNNLSSTYGNALTSFILFKENVFEDLLKTSYMKHLIQDHMPYTPDTVIHIASQGHNINTFKSGVLLSMLGGCNPTQVYIFNQSVQYKGKCCMSQNTIGTGNFRGNDQVQLRDEKSLVHRTEPLIPNQSAENHGIDRTVHCPKTIKSVPCKEKCGAVLRTGIDNQIQCEGSSDLALEFFEVHRLEIEKATALKYETYDAQSEMWVSRIWSLADAAVKFDVLKQNHSSVLHLRPPRGRDGEKNFGVFVQYNYARLSNLFRNFQAKVEDGTYLPLCPLEGADFELLELEDEWHLFSYVLSFPKLVESILDSLVEGRRGRIRLNKVCLMLQELCQCLSLYYGRVRILGGTQLHLQRAMNARLWMLKGIQQVFKNAFRMLNIQGMDLM